MNGKEYILPAGTWRNPSASRIVTDALLTNEAVFCIRKLPEPLWFRELLGGDYRIRICDLLRVKQAL